MSNLVYPMKPDVSETDNTMEKFGNKETNSIYLLKMFMSIAGTYSEGYSNKILYAFFTGYHLLSCVLSTLTIAASMLLFNKSKFFSVY